MVLFSCSFVTQRGLAGEYRISEEIWQRGFGKTPSCRKSSDLRQENGEGHKTRNMRITEFFNRPQVFD
jgi:hypothetical protein